MNSETGHSPISSPQIDWSAVCQSMLERFLPRNSISTQPEEQVNITQQVPRTLMIAAVGHPTRRPSSPRLKYGPQAFLSALQGVEKPKGRRIAIVGEAGTGKTLFLQHCADILLTDPRRMGLPVWISPAQLKHLSLRDYLMGPWLEQAADGHPLGLALWRTSLSEQLQSGKLWILADGMDYRYGELESGVSQGPLSSLVGSLQDWFRINLIVACRLETSRTDAKGLSGFERYQTSNLEYPGDVEMAIADFLAPLSPNDRPQELVQSLNQALAQGNREHLRPWLTSPIRLLLCCRFWQRQPGELPASSTGLYKELTDSFYEWKAELAATSTEQRQGLAIAFGELGKRLLLEERKRNHSLAQSDIEAVFGKNSPLLRLALGLGWLIPRGLVVEGTWERGYSFFDRTFRDYFTALVIPEWQFFLNPDEQIYRIFDPDWQSVIGFWLGREDIAASEKDQFFAALLAFDDRCSPENFYGKRAFQLAAIALREYPSSSHGAAIVERLWQWSQDTEVSASPWQTMAIALLGQTDRAQWVHLLVQKLAETQEPESVEYLCGQLAPWGQGDTQAINTIHDLLLNQKDARHRFVLAETLGLLHKNSALALSTLATELKNPESSENYEAALKGLGTIAQGNPVAINAVLEALSVSLSPAQHRRTLRCLEQIAPQDPLAIASLMQRLRTYPDGDFRCQVAESLEKIDPGNPTAISLLLRLLQPQESADTKKQGIYSLGEISLASPAVLRALVNLLADGDIFIRWLAMSSLAKIGVGQPVAIAALEKLIQEAQGQALSEESEWLLKEGVDALVKVDPGNPLLLKTLVYLLEHHISPQTHQESAELLGRLDPGNPSAINVLLKLLKKSQDEFIQRQAAASLGMIDPGNLTALMALINLLNNSTSKDIRGLAAQSLGEIGQHNPAATAALLRCLDRPCDRDTLRAIVQSLGKIGKGHREVTTLLMELLRRQDDNALRLDIAESLISTLPNKSLASVVHQIQQMCRQPSDHQIPAHWHLLWHCAQYLPYPAFYQAWHQHTLSQEDKVKVSLSLPDSFWVGTDALDLETVYQKAQNPDNKAIAILCGIVSTSSKDPDPALRLVQFNTIAQEIRQRWANINHVVIQQRTGQIAHGDPYLLVAVGGGNYHQALDACHYAVTTLETQA